MEVKNQKSEIKNRDSPRQTLTYLRNLFEAHGIRPKKKLGQSFLIDLNLLDLIVRTAELTPDDLVIEVGAGTGSLTTRLAPSIDISLDRAGGQRSFVRPSLDATLHDRSLSGFETDLHVLGGTLD